MTGAFGWSWLASALALAVHVADEAAHDFLAWYNPRASRIRRALGGLPFPPVFTFRVWLAGLIAGVLLLLALTPLAFAAPQDLRLAAYGIAIIQTANGLFHLAGSAILRRQLPGVWSAPLILAVAVWLWFEASGLP